MRTRAIAVGRVLAFLVTTIAVGWEVGRGVNVVTSSHVGVEAGLTATALLVTWIATKVERRPFASVGYASTSAARDLGVGVALGVAIVGGTAAVLAMLGWYTATPTIPVAPFAWTLTAVGMSALIAIFEETLFRGYALQTLARAFGETSAVVFTGVAFGALHLLNPAPGMPAWLKILGCAFVGISGMLVAVLRFASGALYLPIGIHFAWNLLEEFVFGFADSGIASDDALVHATVRGPVVITGGDYGPEAGILMLVLACASTLFVVRRFSRPTHPVTHPTAS